MDDIFYIGISHLLQEVGIAGLKQSLSSQYIPDYAVEIIHAIEDEDYEAYRSYMVELIDTLIEEVQYNEDDNAYVELKELEG